MDLSIAIGKTNIHKAPSEGFGVFMLVCLIGIVGPIFQLCGDALGYESGVSAQYSFVCLFSFLGVLVAARYIDLYLAKRSAAAAGEKIAGLERLAAEGSKFGGVDVDLVALRESEVCLQEKHSGRKLWIRTSDFFEVDADFALEELPPTRISPNVISNLFSIQLAAYFIGGYVMCIEMMRANTWVEMAQSPSIMRTFGVVLVSLIIGIYAGALTSGNYGLKRRMQAGRFLRCGYQDFMQLDLVNEQFSKIEDGVMVTNFDSESREYLGKNPRENADSPLLEAAPV